jgi:hypothetical protein
MTMTAASLLPDESLALKMAQAQLERGENPPRNTTATLVQALERITAASVAAYIPLLMEASDDDLRDALVLVGADKRRRLRAFLTEGVTS